MKYFTKCYANLFPFCVALKNIGAHGFLSHSIIEMHHKANQSPVILMSSKLCHTVKFKLEKYNKEFIFFLTSNGLAWSRAKVHVTDYSVLWQKTKFKMSYLHLSA